MLKKEKNKVHVKRSKLVVKWTGGAEILAYTHYIFKLHPEATPR